MKKLLSILFICILLTAQYGCGTLYGGQISQCQAHKPPKGQPTRAIRPAAFTCDIVFGFIIFAPITLGIDFLDGAIYRPCEYVTANNNSIQPITNKTKDTNSKNTPPPPAVKMVFTPAKGTPAYLDYKYGFKGLKFETPIDSLKDMVIMSNDTDAKAGEQVFTKATDDLTLGDYKLKEVSYFFVNGKLATILIRTKGYSNSRGVLSMLKDMFGPGFQSNEYIEEYLWEGVKTDCLYDENSISNDATIWLDCKKLRRQKDIQDKKAKQKGESEF